MMADALPSRVASRSDGPVKCVRTSRRPPATSSATANRSARSPGPSTSIPLHSIAASKPREPYGTFLFRSAVRAKPRFDDRSVFGENRVYPSRYLFIDFQPLLTEPDVRAPFYGLAGQHSTPYEPKTI